MLLKISETDIFTMGRLSQTGTATDADIRETNRLLQIVARQVNELIDAGGTANLNRQQHQSSLLRAAGH